MKEIKFTILYCVFVRTFAIPFYYGSGTVINYGSFGSNFLTSYGTDSTRQKVTVPTVRVRVPQHCKQVNKMRMETYPLKRPPPFGASPRACSACWGEAPSEALVRQSPCYQTRYGIQFSLGNTMGVD
jgi:hypothetical protein